MRLYDWQRMILEREGLGAWLVKHGEPYCWFKTKVIHFDENSDDHALFLHEVAHALAPLPEKFGKGQHYHGGAWSSEFGRLVRTYMVPIKL